MRRPSLLLASLVLGLTGCPGGAGAPEPASPTVPVVAASAREVPPRATPAREAAAPTRAAAPRATPAREAAAPTRAAAAREAPDREASAREAEAGARRGPPRAEAPRSDRPAPITREALLAARPEDALRDGLTTAEGRLAPRLSGEGLLALVEQLRAEDTPREALELCLVAFDMARDDLAPGAVVPPSLTAALADDLALHAEGQAALVRWTTALAGAVRTRDDLDAAVELLVRARQVRLVAAALPRRGS